MLPPLFGQTAQRSLQSSLHPPSPLAAARREQRDPWGFSLAPGLAQQSPFVFQKMAHPTFFSHSSSFSQSPGKPGRAGRVADQKEDTSSWMVGEIGRGKRGERLCGTSFLILGEVSWWWQCHIPWQQGEDRREPRRGSRAVRSTSVTTFQSSSSIQSWMFQHPNIKKNPIQLSLSCLIMSSYKALVSNLWKLWLCY